jgi:WD40 repeat protein
MFKIVFPKNTAVAFSPNGEYLAAAGGDETVRLWKVNGWQEIICIRHELRHGYRLTSIAFSPDSRYLATASCYPSSVTLRRLLLFLNEESFCISGDRQLFSE